MSFTLTAADNLAILKLDEDFLLNKGAALYAEEKYNQAIEYYRLAASMGSAQANSNLGYCYMYARSIPKDMELALAYFKIAASQNCVDALYKLGNIYKHGAENVEPDLEMAMLYYTNALEEIGTQNLDALRYPSLLFSVAKEHMPGGSLYCDLAGAYTLLMLAQQGFETEIAEGIHFHHASLDECTALLEDDIFEPVIQGA